MIMIFNPMFWNSFNPLIGALIVLKPPDFLLIVNSVYDFLLELNFFESFEKFFTSYENQNNNNINHNYY